MTQQQQERVQALQEFGGVLDETYDDLVIVWLHGHCMLVTADGEVEEL